MEIQVRLAILMSPSRRIVAGDANAIAISISIRWLTAIGQRQRVSFLFPLEGGGYGAVIKT